MHWRRLADGTLQKITPLRVYPWPRAMRKPHTDPISPSNRVPIRHSYINSSLISGVPRTRASEKNEIHCAITDDQKDENTHT